MIMEKIKEKPTIKDNGEKKKLTRDEMIKQTQAEIAEIVKIYPQKTCYLAGLKETE